VYTSLDITTIVEKCNEYRDGRIILLTLAALVAITVVFLQQQVSAFHDTCGNNIDTTCMHKDTHSSTPRHDKNTPFILPFP
jgi:hypothetical protein